ncbi:hypothetical protein [Halobellus rubicundus]|uniref:Uncharacterized protein n=1 Tax=Halobellus rubicundus TaxID=2996466 RepID=A0ABD5MIR0_9EURY
MVSGAKIGFCEVDEKSDPERINIPSVAVENLEKTVTQTSNEWESTVEKEPLALTMRGEQFSSLTHEVYDVELI